MRDIYQTITDGIASKLEQGKLPWAQPWKNNPAAADMPSNFITGKPYRGANVFWLWMQGNAMGYTSQLWLTYKQAETAGGNVRKGEKSTPVFFWKRGEKVNKTTGETEKTFMVREYKVFNIAQCEGLEAPAVITAKSEFERNAEADSVILATGANIRHKGNRACYIPSIDAIDLPARDQFFNADGYYSTAFHELGHWTGHESRLAREYGKRFGDDAYAFEELVAELTAAFVCASQGIASIERDDHAAYIGNWLSILRGDKKAFMTAASAAQKAADLIRGISYQGKAEAEPADDAQAPALAQAA